MNENELRTALVITNYIIGAIIAIISLKLFFKKGAIAPLFITAAVVIVGPVEDLLMQKVKPEEKWIVNQITSIGFLIFLLLAVLQTAR